MKKPKEFPFLISVGDYHQFRTVQDILGLVSPGVKVVEIGTMSKLTQEIQDLLEDFPSPCTYPGIVYMGKRPSNKVILDLLRREEIQEIW